MFEPPRWITSVAFALLLAGCASRSFEDRLNYHDQRLVTTRPAGDAGRAPADLLVHVERLNVHGMPARDEMPDLDELPANAALVLAVESLATYGAPFYATVQRPRGRVELGGRIVRAEDGSLRVELDLAESSPGGMSQISTNVIVRPEERIVVSMTSHGVGAAAKIRELTILRVSPLTPR